MAFKLLRHFVTTVRRLMNGPDDSILGRWNLKYKHIQYYENKNYPY